VTTTTTTAKQAGMGVGVKMDYFRTPLNTERIEPVLRLLSGQKRGKGIEKQPPGGGGGKKNVLNHSQHCNQTLGEPFISTVTGKGENEASIGEKRSGGRI